MLILSRKRGQKIFIGDDVVVTVIDIERGRIRLAIEAPAQVQVNREERLAPGRREQMRRDATEA